VLGRVEGRQGPDWPGRLYGGRPPQQSVPPKFSLALVSLRWVRSRAARSLHVAELFQQHLWTDQRTGHGVWSICRARANRLAADHFHSAALPDLHSRLNRSGARKPRVHDATRFATRVSLAILPPIAQLSGGNRERRLVKRATTRPQHLAGRRSQRER